MVNIGGFQRYKGAPISHPNSVDHAFVQPASHLQGYTCFTKQNKQFIILNLNSLHVETSSQEAEFYKQKYTLFNYHMIQTSYALIWKKLDVPVWYKAKQATYISEQAI